MKRIFLLWMLFFCLAVESQSQSILSEYPEFILEELEQYVREQGYSQVTINVQKTGEVLEVLEFDEEGHLAQIDPNGQGVIMTSSFGGVQMTESFLDELGTSFDYNETGDLISKVVRTEIDGRLTIDSLRNNYQGGRLVSSKRYFISDNPHVYMIKDRVGITEYEYANDRMIKEIKYDRLTIRDTVQLLNSEEIIYDWIGNSECRLTHHYLETNSLGTNYVEKKYFDVRGRLILWHEGEVFDEDEWWTRCSYESERAMVFESHMKTRIPKYIREELKYNHQGKLRHIKMSDGSKLIFDYKR